MKKFVNVMMYIIVVVFIATMINAVIDKSVELYMEIKQVEELEQEVRDLKLEVEELWKNIDAISEDYTTIWIELYGEDSWHQ